MSLANGLLNDDGWTVKTGSHVLVMVSEQGANIGGWMHISFIKWLVSMVFILSIVTRIQMEFWYDIKKNMCPLYCYKISGWYDEKLLCCRQVKICQFTENKQRASQCFHLHVRVPPTAVPGWVDRYRYRYIVFIIVTCDIIQDKQYSHTSNEYSHPAPGGLIIHFYLDEIQS